MFTVGQVAKQAGVNVQTIRYYEREGVLPRAARTPSGYRKFPEDAVRIVRFVRRAQELGFSLDEIKGLLRLRSMKGADCARVQELAGSKMRVVTEKIESLTRMQAALETLLRSCQRRKDRLDCPMLEALETPLDLIPDYRV